MFSDIQRLPNHDDKVRVVFMIQRISVDPAAEHVYIVGSVPALGDWDITCAKQTGYSGLNSWIVEAFFEPHSTVDFKICVLSQTPRGLLGADNVTPMLVHREDGWFRRLCLTDVPVSAKIIYNRPEFVATPLKSRLTVDGRPWCLQGDTPGRTIHQKNAATIQKAVSEVTNDTHCVYTEVVLARHILDEVLHDTRQLRSNWAHLKSAVSKDQARQGKDQPGKDKVQAEKGEDQPRKGEVEAERGEDQPRKGGVQAENVKNQPRKGEVEAEKGDDQPRKAEDQARKGDGKKERKKRWKKKRKETLRKLLKKYGIEEDKNDAVESEKLLAVDEVSRKEETQQINEEISEETTVETGSGDWGRVIKIAAPVGLGLGVAAAAAMYFWCRQK